MCLAKQGGGLVVAGGKRGISPRRLRGGLDSSELIRRMMMERTGKIVRTRVCPSRRCTGGRKLRERRRIHMRLRGLVSRCGRNTPTCGGVCDLVVHRGRFRGATSEGVGECWGASGGI